MTGPIRPIKTGGRPAGSVAGLNLETIQARFSSTDPGAVVDAGIAYSDAARQLAAAEEEFAKAIKYLTDHWRGDAADTALQELRKLEANARELAARSEQTGTAVQRYGQILSKYQAVTLDPGFIHTGKDDRYAQALMARLNTRAAETYDALPDQVGLSDTNISPAAATSSSTAAGQISGASGSGSAALPGSTSHGHGGAGTDGSGARHGAGNQVVGGGTDLAGLSSAGPSPLGTGPGPSGLGVGGGGAVPGVAGGAIASPTTGPAAFLGPGAGTGRGLGGGRGAGLGRSGLVGAGGVVGGAPAGDSENDERDRAYWLSEDRGTWSGSDEVVSAVIGREDRPLPSGDELDTVDAVDLDDERDQLIGEERDPDVSDLLSSDDGDVEIVELEAEAGDADQPDYDDIDKFLDDVLGDDDIDDGQI